MDQQHTDQECIDKVVGSNPLGSNPLRSNSLGSNPRNPNIRDTMINKKSTVTAHMRSHHVTSDDRGIYCSGVECFVL